MAYDDVLANLGEVDDERLNSAHGEITGRINELRPKVSDRSLTNDELTELQSLTETFGQVNGEVQTRQQRRDDAYAAIDETVSQVPDPAAETEQPAETERPEAEVEQPAEAEGTGPAPDQQNESAAEAAPTSQEQPVAAAASNPPIGSIGRQAPEQTSRQAPHPTVGITAAADVSGFTAGGTVEPTQVGQAFSNRMRSLSAIASRHGNGEQVPVVTLTASGVPDERRLLRNDWAGNTRRMDQVTSRTAITAAGGLCAPLAIDYSYGTIGVQDRPIRDSLPGFQAERGGIQYRRDLSPVTNTAADGPRSATDVWSMADDEAQGTTPETARTKGLWVVDCPDTETAEVEALTLQLEFSNVTSRFDPETLQANTDAAMIWHARFAENYLLGKLQDLSKLMLAEQVLGATRDLLFTLDAVQAYYRSVHRLSSNLQLRAILPAWARTMIRADMARAMSFGTDTLNVTDAMIDAWLGSRNLTPVWHLDGEATAQVGTAVPDDPSTPDTDESVAGTPNIAAQQYTLAADGGANGTPVPAFPAQVDFLLHAEGHFTHLDGGTLDLGIVRDSDLIERNRYRQFSETWEGVAARGVEALRVVANVTPSGAMSGTSDAAFPASV